MQAVKQELLQALASTLEGLQTGAGDRAAFENPKVAEHGDLATNAAMQLAKPLKMNPRALAEQIKTSLEACTAFQKWVAAVEIAGPGFINIRLKPEAKQQTVRAILAQGAAYGQQPDNGQRIFGGVCVRQPDWPSACGTWPPSRLR